MGKGNSPGKENNKTEKDKAKKMVRISESRQCGGQNQVTEVIMETTFQQPRSIKRAAEKKNETNSDSSDSIIPYAEWKTMGKRRRNLRRRDPLHQRWRLAILELLHQHFLRSSERTLQWWRRKSLQS